jgi:ubiquinone/menaquinone biosynthesis C-methylase UbiE
MERSVAFDRAADYYDTTRGLSDTGRRRQNELLTQEFAGRGRVLEVGVGTGQVALPLLESGVDVIGFDLARPMMNKLIEKTAGRRTLPLLQADATRMPFEDGAFGAAYFRWVLHLIPDWRGALSESVRVARRGGVVLVLPGSAGKGTSPQAQIHARFAELTGASFEPRGLRWSGYDQLDDEMAALGASPRALPTFTDVERDGLEAFLDSLEQRRYSWTWRIEDDVRFAQAVAEIRRFAQERFGPLHQVPREAYEVAWRAYDLPAPR